MDDETSRLILCGCYIRVRLDYAHTAGPSWTTFDGHARSRAEVNTIFVMDSRIWRGDLKTKVSVGRTLLRALTRHRH
jgi:hypothetical protein